MATYQVKRKDDGTVEIWARFTAVKGGPRRTRVFAGPRSDVEKTSLAAVNWVDEQRYPPNPRKGTTGEPKKGGSG